MFIYCYAMSTSIYFMSDTGDMANQTYVILIFVKLSLQSFGYYSVSSKMSLKDFKQRNYMIYCTQHYCSNGSLIQKESSNMLKYTIGKQSETHESGSGWNSWSSREGTCVLCTSFFLCLRLPFPQYLQGWNPSCDSFSSLNYSLSQKSFFSPQSKIYPVTITQFQLFVQNLSSFIFL